MRPLLLLFLSFCLSVPLSVRTTELNSHGNDIDYNTLVDDKTMDWLLTTYKMLHAAPELSHHEEKTSEFFAAELRKLGFAVTEHIGKYERPERIGYGVVGVMKNGTGPTVMLRTELDALPVEEKTDVPYASKVKTKNDLGVEVSVMHACGHDIHITSMLGTASDPNLAPEVNGTNIEALASDGAGKLLVGFRNPRPAGKAIVVAIANPDAALTGAARFANAFELDLGGLGIRSMTRAASGIRRSRTTSSSGRGRSCWVRSAWARGRRSARTLW